MLDNSKIKRREKNYYSNINVKKKKALKRDYTLINFKEYRFNVRHLENSNRNKRKGCNQSVNIKENIKKD